MRIISLIILLLALLPCMAYAGHGTIRETDSQIIIEYEGDANEVTAANIAKVRDERLKEQEEQDKAKEVERFNKFSEDNAKLREERRAKYKEGYED